MLALLREGRYVQLLVHFMVTFVTVLAQVGEFFMPIEAAAAGRRMIPLPVGATSARRYAGVIRSRRSVRSVPGVSCRERDYCIDPAIRPSSWGPSPE
jgi:hypothetical protein